MDTAINRMLRAVFGYINLSLLEISPEIIDGNCGSDIQLQGI